ncbi:hypothetical protein QF048_007675 [Streptomyces sp. W4I9-2]|nr:hypothetical protein [Streptomyces sp. W4I9-2]
MTAQERLAVLSLTVQRLFIVVGADQILRIHATLDAARTG